MLQTLPPLTDVRSAPDTDAGFGALRTERGALPLIALDVRARVDGLIAGVEMTQTFANTHGESLEATYIFPLPDRAAVTAFRVEVAGRVIEGDLQERGQARRTYDAAIQAGHRAAIAEEERPGVFTMRVGNLPPGERAVVRLSLVGPLPYSDGEATFRFPLVVAPRYIPGSTLPGEQAGSGVALDTDSVPDASRISPPTLLPGFPNPVRLSLRVDVHAAGLSPHSFRSSLHTVVEEGGTFRLEPGERLDRDFVLRWRLAGEGVSTSLLVSPDATGDEGTFLLTLVPPAHLAEAQRPRDVVFVLDRSGSMSGWKMVTARRAVARMVEELNERDRFTVYAFDTSIETPPGFDGVSLVPASDRMRFRAAEFLAGVADRGGTEMAEPLRKAVAELSKGGNTDRVLVLITDGQVGNEDEILRTLGPALGDIRVFTLGIDRAVNEAFLRRLAQLGRGVCEVVESERRLDEVMDQIHRHVGTPVLTQLALTPAGLGVVAETVVPSRLPDLFAGSPVLISGRYKGTPAGAVVVRGTEAKGEKWGGEVTAACQPNAPLMKVWGRVRVRELEDRYAVGNADRAALEREIVAVSLKCGVLSRFTAYVAVDRSEAVNPGGEAKQITQPVEAPSGWGEAEALMAQAAPAGAVFGLASSRAYRSVARSAPASPPPAACAAPVERTTTTDFDALEACSPPRRRKLGQAGAIISETADRKSDTGTLWDAVKSLFGMLGRDPQPSPDLAALRSRAEVLRQRLEGVADVAGRLVALRASQQDLTDLVRDLLAAGDTSDALLELSKQVSGLQQALGGAPSDEVVNRYHEGVLLALRAWLGADPAATAGRGAFWK